MMELHIGKMYWTTTLQHVKTYPKLQQKRSTTVAIIGGGMSGSICSYVFAQSGISVVVLERNEIAGGSTSANTGLLQFSNDVMLHQLMQQIGDEPAVRFYQACLQAVQQLETIAKALPQQVDFSRRQSLYYASSEQELPKLKKEFQALHDNGFPVAFWSADDISARFPFRKPGAIVTSGDAEVNPFQFVHHVADAAAAMGAEIYEQTEIINHSTRGGKHILETVDGAVVEADHVIYAIGYEPEELRGKLIKADINRSFVAVTEPLPSLNDVWKNRMMIWETARPYLYMRTTPDNRIIVGGLDEDKSEPVKGHIALQKHTDRLSEKIVQHFPAATAPVAYSWSGTFGESCDNLPFIGEDPEWPQVYYCLGYGGNGTVYSMIAAGLLHDCVAGKKHPIADIVQLTRPSLLVH
ncbi:FAD-binding oxidoreductase [Paenibacillaceae bacterium]|nr:FAD-binding oxidoreductase [Paenibacillaceae bacterium]